MNDLIFAGSEIQADEQAFRALFTGWYGPLCAYAASLLKDESLAAEAVQAVFCRLWAKRAEIRIRDSLKAYLFGSVYHECVSWLRKEKTRRIYVSEMMKRRRGDAEGNPERASDRAELGELERRFIQALDEVPEPCRTVFQLNRFGELTYREIAEQLGVSVKAVEATCRIPSARNTQRNTSGRMVLVTTTGRYPSTGVAIFSIKRKSTEKRSKRR